MPRPGPRPYECVRRAWHSDRHQPIRGSLIQQVFRVVTEAHSSTTRKNREWQEKLPRVVLKAEEIMYSKANSEGEYTDPETLWERLNDAVDTIIRRDESTETGQFLQPCIEAALVLGCVPVRASRSQRHSNPRSYLSPSFQEPAHAAAAVPDKTTNPGTPPQTATPSSNYLSMPMTMEVKQSVSFPFTGSQIAPINSFMTNHAGPNLPRCFPRPMPPVASEANSSLNLRTVYPLYHGSHFQSVQPQFRFQSRQTSNPENIIIGRPVSWHGVQRSCSSSTRNLLPGERVGTEADKHELVKEVDSCGKAVELDCDLSLRLGPSEPSVEKHLAYLKKDGGSSSHQGISKNSDPYAKNHEISFFPMCNANDPSHSCTSKMELEDEAFDMNTTFRKRKAADHCEIEEESTQWVSKLQHNQFYGQSKWPGR